MVRMVLLTASIIALIPFAYAEEPLIACPSQQELEQVLQSGGELIPEGCRRLIVSRVETAAGPLCMIDFQPRNPGMLDRLAEVAAPMQWWVRCEVLADPPR